MVKIAEPTWGVPQEPEECSSMAYTGPQPFIMSGFIKRLLEYHFSDPRNIENPLLKCYIWTPAGSCTDEVIEQDDGESITIPGSRIFIGSHYQRNFVNAMQRPALLVKREPVRISEISMRNKALPGIDPSTGIYPGETLQVNIDSAISIICIGMNGAEAENLGEEVMYRMLHYMPVIRDETRSGKFFVRALSEVKSLDTDPKKGFYTTVRCEFAYVHRWRVIPETPILKRFALDFQETD